MDVTPETLPAVALLSGLRSSLPTGATRRIVEILGRRIAGGSYAPGTVIPREDELAQALGVSRTTVRDAIKVLSGKSLLRTARRYGTRVQPVDDWNLLDPDVLAWHDPVHPRFRAIFSEAMALRRMIEPEAAGLAALRASAGQSRAILEAARGLAMTRGAVVQGLAADGRFHATVIAATGNLMLRQLSPTIVSMLRIAGEQGASRVRFDPGQGAAHLAVAEAIRDGDACAARARMRALAYPDLGGSDN
ncbi:FadR/GntR family transcriptional regulator [Marinovum sp.]|uniref:FadR/GntR family transcriptional regulator n=1 Tax=Marinovum sp. TaxID=2024839 RepID=UPI002B267261|nr:GntR family transcriptional regulator [Marinovum sp.]